MTAYNFGDVVLIGFPHTDLLGVSKRPAFVIEPEQENIKSVLKKIFNL